MRNKLYLSLIALTAGAFMHSCQDFIEIDLSKKSITILAPANNTVSSDFSQQFKWEEVKGADKYQLQIVKPNFSAVQQFVLDTTTSATQFSFTLQPGSYQWRVRAKNSSSATDYVIYTINIDSTQDLSRQKIILLTPKDNTYRDSLKTTFTWSALQTSTNYIFQIFDESNAPVPNSFQNVSTNKAAFTFTSQGTFKWRVFAQNASSTSPYSEFTITIDTTHPAIPVIISPKNDTTMLTASPVPLTWNMVTNATAYRVEITDSTSINVITDTTLANTVYNFYNSRKAATYYWRVKSIRNTNASPYSPRVKFRRK